MSETTTSSEPPRVESPPATPIPVRDAAPDPRAQLHKLASELVRARNRKVLVEYLRMRRAVR